MYSQPPPSPRYGCILVTGLVALKSVTSCSGFCSLHGLVRLNVCLWNLAQYGCGGGGGGYVITQCWPPATSNYLMDDPQHYNADIISPNKPFYIHNIGSIHQGIIYWSSIQVGKVWMIIISFEKHQEILANILYLTLGSEFEENESESMQ